ncbi:hypothetical protein H0E87_019964 [Populus deltoides]|uniref:FAF domain-containing protein n=1 Tax=Populus deltoides TaxID=3696 RepID=A0A8T2XXD1_POPDE|nr:hypothetical protein H0E87_019964 [Populus deltoides]
MEGNGFSSLKDLSKSPSHPRPNLVRSQSIPATWGYVIFSNTNETTNVDDGFSDLSLEESSLSSINSLDATLPYSSSPPPSCLTSLSDVMSEATFDQKDEEIMNVDARKYLNYNEENDSFELEEIKIPQGDILRANRSGGRLRLTFVVSDDESSDIEEEEEIMEEEETSGTVE